MIFNEYLVREYVWDGEDSEARFFDNTPMDKNESSFF